MMTTSSTCRSCGAAIWWVTNSTTGRRAPIEMATHEKGNCVLDLMAGTYEALNRARATVRRTTEGPLHRNHFQACPAAAEWRKTG